MTRSSRRKSPSKPPTDPLGQEIEVDVDATERFVREGFLNPDEQGKMILTVPPDAEEADLALTQPLPKATIDEFDEDLIRTHEMPRVDDTWMEEILEPGKRPPRPRLASKPEGTGQFAHPALAPRTGSVPKRSPSSEDLPPATVRAPHDETQARIREAYHHYFTLCRKHAQAVVGEAAFAARLRKRLDKLAERYPQDKIVFRPVVEDGVVRVRVLLARKKT